MTVVIYILALMAYLFCCYIWVMGAYYTIAGDYTLKDQWEWTIDDGPLGRILIVFYLISIPVLIALGVLGTMAYF